MAKIYVRKIQVSDGGYTIEQVPVRWRDEVKSLLEVSKLDTGETEGV